MAESGYVPMLPPEGVERIRRWHEAANRQGREEAAGGDQTFDYLGLTLVVPPEVMPIAGVSHLLGSQVLAEVREGDRVLDMGTGSGVNAILAASKSTDVVAVDVNPEALRAARENAVRNGVADRVDVRHSDVFEAVEGRFDLIVFDPPFRWFTPVDLRDAATTDGNYQAMTRFFREVGGYLTPAGRLLVFFGTSGDLAYLRHLFAEAGLTAEVRARGGAERDGWPVDYYTFRLTR